MRGGARVLARWSYSCYRALDQIIFRPSEKPYTSSHSRVAIKALKLVLRVPKGKFDTMKLLKLFISSLFYCAIRLASKL